MRITKITAGILALAVPMGIVTLAESTESTEFTESTEVIEGTVVKEGIEYTVKDDGSLRVTRIINTELTNVIIPEEVNGYKVTELGDRDGMNVFGECENVTAVMLPAGITSIGDFCFYGVSGLKDVYFAGTAEQFRKMYIGIENGSLEDAQFHFDSGIPDIEDIPDLGMKGDANEDGVVNARDATMILKHTVGLVTLSGTAFQNADMDGDNVVNARDATAVLKKVVGIE